MTHALFGQLGKSVLIGSGAMGTCLRAGRTMPGPVELLNIRQPEAVLALHRAYREAGANILITNTFSANTLALREAGLLDEGRRINEAGVALARQAAGSDAMVWASVGPLSLGLRHDDFQPQDLLDIYAEQCRGLAAADALILETFTDPREAAAALQAASATGRPVIFQIGNIGGGRGRWDRIEALLGLAIQSGVAAVGTNCCHPNDIVDVAGYLTGRTSLPVTASANAGHPILNRGLVNYEFSADEFQRVGERLAAAGVSVVGGCCGTTPDHIKRLASLLKARPVAVRKTVVAPASAKSEPDVQPFAGNRVRQLMVSDRLIISVEIRADRKRSLEQILAGAKLIAEAGADMFDVPDNPGATVGRDAMVVASELQKRTGLPSLCHKTVIQSNLLQMHSSLIGCWDLGLEGILAVTGDPPSMGHLGGMAKMVSDLKSSVELLRLVRNMRNGKMINGESIADPPDLCAGCAFGHVAPPQINWLRKKVEAGAEYVFSQPVFSVESYQLLRDSLSGIAPRLFPGIMPLVSRKNAEFLADGRIPGIRVPPELADRFRGIESEAEQRRFGLSYAADMAVSMARDSAGIYLIMPFGKQCYEETAEIVRAIRRIRS